MDGIATWVLEGLYSLKKLKRIGGEEILITTPVQVRFLRVFSLSLSSHRGRMTMYIRLSKLWYAFFIMVAFFSLVFQVGIFCNAQVYCMFPPKCYFRWLNMAASEWHYEFPKGEKDDDKVVSLYHIGRRRRQPQAAFSWIWLFKRTSRPINHGSNRACLSAWWWYKQNLGLWNMSSIHCV